MATFTFSMNIILMDHTHIPYDPLVIKPGSTQSPVSKCVFPFKVMIFQCRVFFLQSWLMVFDLIRKEFWTPSYPAKAKNVLSFLQRDWVSWYTICESPCILVTCTFQDMFLRSGSLTSGRCLALVVSAFWCCAMSLGNVPCELLFICPV